MIRSALADLPSKAYHLAHQTIYLEKMNPNPNIFTDHDGCEWEMSCTCNRGCTKCEPGTTTTPEVGTDFFAAWQDCVCYSGCPECLALQPRAEKDKIRWWRKAFGEWLRERPESTTADFFYDCFYEHELPTNPMFHITPSIQVEDEDDEDDDEGCRYAKLFKKFHSKQDWTTEERDDYWDVMFRQRAEELNTEQRGMADYRCNFGF